MPLSIEMNKIDTEYKSLSEIDPEIVHFYSEDVRTRVTGHTEPDEEGNTSPITKEYVVIVLNQPDEVSYDYVESRRGRRLGEEVAKAALVQAIAWNDFAVNHDGYLSWLEAHAVWEDEQPTEIVEEEEVLLPAPVRPVVDIADQREVYEKVTQPFDTNLFTSDGSTVEYDDELFVATTIPMLTDKPAEEVSAYHSGLAIEVRFDAIYAPVETTHGSIDVGRGKDGILGMENIKDTLLAHGTGSVEADTVAWIMTDNSVAYLTVDDLSQVVVDFNLRKQSIFEAYSVWRAGDKLTPFVV